MLQFVQLEVSATLKQIKVYAVNMWVTIVIEIIQVGLSVAIMQVAYAHGNFYCNYAGRYFCCSHVCDSFASSSNFIFLSLTVIHFS